MAGGDGGTTVSRVIESERERGARNFRVRDLMRDAPLVCASPFS
jgi:hypothetical protein